MAGEEKWPIPKAEMGSLGVKDLPSIPLGKMYKLGPSIIVLGIALGGGELIMWPRLTAQYGAGLMWLAILGVSLQWFINVELGRYTIATGESFLVCFSHYHLYVARLGCDGRDGTGRIVRRNRCQLEMVG
jgi:hypothetical protein